MSPEQRKWFDNWNDMFATPGWKQLVEDMETSIEAINSLDMANSLESLFENKGKLKVLRYIVQLPEYINISYEQAELTEADNAEDV